jgi:fatty-acyl-CoA synthase
MGMARHGAIWEAESFGAELIDTTIGALLDEQALRFAHNEAIVFNDPQLALQVRWTYAQYRDHANALAKGLLALGIGKGDRVAVLAPNLPEWILLEIAVAKVGAVLVTVNTAYKRAELEYLLCQGEVHALFLTASFRGNAYYEALTQIVPELARLREPRGDLLESAALPMLRRVVVIDDPALPGTLCFADVVALGRGIADRALRLAQDAVKPHDLAQIQYTSGTTGHPKGVMLTHHNTVNNANLLSARGQFTSRDRMATAMPLFHTAGCVCNVLAMLSKGGTLVEAMYFDAAMLLQLIAAEKCTLLNAVPTMLIRMLEHPDFKAGKYDVSSLRTAFVGGTSISPTLMAKVKDEMGADPMIIMGMTEASPIITQTLPADRFELKASTAGVPLPFTEVKVVDPVTGGLKAHDEAGELLIRGYLVMKGYYNMADRTAETIDADGWLHSGDLATLDERGYLRIVGRTKDMIIRGGENIYPAEIEDFLLSHPKIAQAYVVGVPDGEMGEEAFAWLQIKAGHSAEEGEIREHCRANLSRHKVPRYMRFTEEFPLTASGKVKKFELKERALIALGLPGAESAS